MQLETNTRFAKGKTQQLGSTGDAAPHADKEAVGERVRKRRIGKEEVYENEYSLGAMKAEEH